MDFALTPEQQELKSAGARVARGALPARPRLRGPQDDRWAELAELGWLGVSIAEEDGGAGLGFVEEALLFEEMGYALYPGPYSPRSASRCRRSAGAAGRGRGRRRELVGRVNGLVAGSRLGRLRRRRRTAPRTPARGAEEHVGRPDAAARPARAADGTPLDGARDLPRARDRARRPRPSASRSARSSSRSRTPASASSSASRSASTRPSRTSSRTRTLTSSSRARSPYWAAWCVAEDDEQAPVAAAAAKAFADGAAVAACERSIQVHGGIGFTWEHPLHRFYKRALWLEGFGARPTALRAEIADAVIGAPVTA